MSGGRPAMHTGHVFLNNSGTTGALTTVINNVNSLLKYLSKQMHVSLRSCDRAS
jgi:hypothetical protein